MHITFKFDGGSTLSHEVFERTFTVGRSAECRVSIDSEHFSREHCLIELIDGKIFVTDQNSKNGVFINHIRLPKKMKTHFDPKLTLYMGECFVSFDISKDLKDPDYLSLETHASLNPNEIYQAATPLKRAPQRPRPEVKRQEEKHFLDGKGVIFAFLILIAISAVHFYRSRIPVSAAPVETPK